MTTEADWHAALLPDNWGPGVQAFDLHFPGWNSSMPEVHEFTDRAQAERWMTGQLDYWVRYANRAEFTWYGYDPLVRDEDTGFVFGTDGYPDAHACITDLDAIVDGTDPIPWEAT